LWISVPDAGKFLEESRLMAGIEKSSHSTSKWCMLRQASELAWGNAPVFGVSR